MIWIFGEFMWDAKLDKKTCNKCKIWMNCELTKYKQAGPLLNLKHMKPGHLTTIAEKLIEFS